MNILELIEDTVEVDAKTFGLAVLEKVAKLNVTPKQMEEFEELVEYWTERMEDDVENLLDMILVEDCDCEDEHCHCGCGCDDECDCEDDCECDEECECGCNEDKKETCTCGDPECTCGCREGKPCTCEEEKPEESNCSETKKECKSQHKSSKCCSK